MDRDCTVTIGPAEGRRLTLLVVIAAALIVTTMKAVFQSSDECR